MEAADLLPKTSEFEEEFLARFSSAKRMKKLPFKERLIDLQQREGESLDVDILEHWSNQHVYDAEMAAVAQVAMAVPVSQFSLERIASHSPLVLTEMIIDLLVVQLNDPQILG